MKRISLVFLCALNLQAGEGSLRVPYEMQGTEISDRPGAKLPLDIQLTTHEGKLIFLRDYLAENKTPFVLTLGYYKCPMLCSLVLNGLTSVMKDQSLRLGKDYRVLSLSINPKETPDLAAERRVNYLKSFGASQDQDWTFAVGSAAAVKRLADTVGFGYRLHEASGEYVHSAGIFIVSPEGVLTRTLYGISYKPQDFKMSLMDASHGKIGSLLDRVILSCFHYEPDSHRYGVYVFGVMRVASLLMVFILGTVLFIFWRRE